MCYAYVVKLFVLTLQIKLVLLDGFRKVIGAEQGGLRSEKDEWEFFNGNFNRYHPELLENVKRKATPEEKKVKNEDVSKVLNDVQDMKGKQDEMTMKLDQIKR